jgi:hypothetical protein
MYQLAKIISVVLALIFGVLVGILSQSWVFGLIVGFQIFHSVILMSITAEIYDTFPKQFRRYYH